MPIKNLSSDHISTSLGIAILITCALPIAAVILIAACANWLLLLLWIWVLTGIIHVKRHYVPPTKKINRRKAINAGLLL